MIRKINPPLDLKSKKIVLLLTALFFTIGLRAQSINFDYTDGTNTSYFLEDVQKITFNVNIMNLHLKDGSVYSWDINSIKQYNYNELQNWLNNLNALELVIFPNPSSSIIKVCYNLQNEEEISLALFDVNGKLILQKNLGKQNSGKHQQILDISNFQEGTYTCRLSGSKQSMIKTLIKK